MTQKWHQFKVEMIHQIWQWLWIAVIFVQHGFNVDICYDFETSGPNDRCHILMTSQEVISKREMTMGRDEFMVPFFISFHSFTQIDFCWHLSLGLKLCVSFLISVQNPLTTKKAPIQIWYKMKKTSSNLNWCHFV